MADRILDSNRADNVIALARVVLATFTLAASLADPPLPLATSGIVIQLLAAYLAFALLFLVWLNLRPVWARRVGVWPHVADLALVAALIYLTTGSASPFFTIYLFIILSSTLKWDARGAFWTTGLVALLFLPSAFVRIDDTFGSTPGEPLRYMMRLLQVIVCGALLVFIGRQRERSWRELIALARAIPRGDGSLEDSVIRCLSHARAFLDLPRAIMAWEYEEEPGWHALAQDVSGVTALPIADAGLPATDIAAWAAGLPPNLVAAQPAGAARSLLLDAEGRVGTGAHPMPPDLAAAWRLTNVTIATISAGAVRAVLILPGRASAGDFQRVRALTVPIAAALDNAVAALAWRTAAASEERLRLSRNLHDGVLQFLTGLALQLQLLRRRSDDPVVTERIAALEDALRVERADMRNFVDRASAEGVPALADFCGLLARQWDVTIDHEALAEPPHTMALHVRQIIREAVANAVRHGGARRLTVQATGDGRDYRLRIVDDGRGLDVTGAFDADELRRSGLGPRSILDRISRLGGNVKLDSGGDGVALDIHIPLQHTEVV